MRFTNIIATNTASAAANGRNTKPPSPAKLHTLNEQNFHNAIAISVTDTGLSNARSILMIGLSRQRSSPERTAESMKYDGTRSAADATTDPNTQFRLYPKNVAAFRLTGPGVICVSAIRFEKSSGVIFSNAASAPAKVWK